MADILDLILADHAAVRRGFAELEQASSNDERTRLWSALTELLERHARAEERVFYPSFLHRVDHPNHDTRDAIRDHNAIRDAIAESRTAAVGDVAWWRAVKQARKENDEHLAEEERGPIPEFREQAPVETRLDLGEKFAEFHARHAHGAGISPEDVSPKEYIERNS